MARPSIIPTVKTSSNLTCSAILTHAEATDGVIPKEEVALTLSRPLRGMTHGLLCSKADLALQDTHIATELELQDTKVQLQDAQQSLAELNNKYKALY